MKTISAENGVYCSVRKTGTGWCIDFSASDLTAAKKCLADCVNYLKNIKVNKNDVSINTNSFDNLRQARIAINNML